MSIGLFPGSFDPPSLGHVDIIRRAAAQCEILYVGIAENSEKRSAFSSLEKRQMLERVCADISNVRVVTFPGLVVEFAKEHQVNFLIRGLRAFSDFEYEFRMALANRKLTGIETLFLMADPNLAHISSTLLKDIAKHGTHLTGFIPDTIEPLVYERLNS